MHCMLFISILSIYLSENVWVLFAAGPPQGKDAPWGAASRRRSMGVFTAIQERYCE